jgi:NAD+ kinase
MSMKNRIKTVSIVANPDNVNMKAVLLELLEALNRYHVDVLFEKRAAEVLGHGWHSSETDIREKSDFMIVLGGDGTVLSAARLLDSSEVPILGIHMGKLGFITEINPNEMKDALSAVMEHRLPTHRRMRIQCEIIRNGEAVFKAHALNDVTINKGGLARMVEFDVFSGHNRVGSYRADGFIVSTPTGSTGYALSAGGAIVDPSMQLMLLCPICAHSMTSRELIVPHTNIIRIELTQPRQDIYVSQDGQVGKNLIIGDSLVIKRTDFDTIIYYKPERNFYDYLRSKFGWEAN